MPNERPDPDELLRRLAEEEKQEKRGKLTVFFGAAPGRRPLVLTRIPKWLLTLSPR